MIIPVQSDANAAESIKAATTKKLKKIKKPATDSASATATDSTATATTNSVPVKETDATAVASKNARKTFSKYSIKLKSISCLAHILAQVAEFYPIESARYFNNFRFRQLNSKTSECECTFHSHLTAEELVDILRQNPNEFIKESTDTLQSIGKKKLGTVMEGEDDAEEEMDI